MKDSRVRGGYTVWRVAECNQRKAPNSLQSIGIVRKTFPLKTVFLLRTLVSPLDPCTLENLEPFLPNKLGEEPYFL